MAGFANWFSKPVEMLAKAAEAAPVQTTDAKAAMARVLAEAGATRPARDKVDARVVAGVRAGTGRIIDSQWEVGGWPEYRSVAPPPDRDRDGMPDAWEKARGLNPADASDAAALAEGGYTNVEVYLNSLAVPPKTPVAAQKAAAGGKR